MVRRAAPGKEFTRLRSQLGIGKAATEFSRVRRNLGIETGVLTTTKRRRNPHKRRDPKAQSSGKKPGGVRRPLCRGTSPAQKVHGIGEAAARDSSEGAMLKFLGRSSLALSKSADSCVQSQRGAGGNRDAAEDEVDERDPAGSAAVRKTVKAGKGSLSGASRNVSLDLGAHAQWVTPLLDGASSSTGKRRDLSSRRSDSPQHRMRITLDAADISVFDDFSDGEGVSDPIQEGAADRNHDGRRSREELEKISLDAALASSAHGKDGQGRSAEELGSGISVQPEIPVGMAPEDIMAADAAGAAVHAHDMKLSPAPESGVKFSSGEAGEEACRGRKGKRANTASVSSPRCMASRSQARGQKRGQDLSAEREEAGPMKRTRPGRTAKTAAQVRMVVQKADASRTPKALADSPGEDAPGKAAPRATAALRDPRLDDEPKSAADARAQAGAIAVEQDKDRAVNSKPEASGGDHVGKDEQAHSGSPRGEDAAAGSCAEGESDSREPAAGPVVKPGSISGAVVKPGSMYVTKENETPRSIAKRMGMALDTFLKINQDTFPGVSLRPSSKFRQGTHLFLSAAAATAALAAGEAAAKMAPAAALPEGSLQGADQLHGQAAQSPPANVGDVCGGPCARCTNPKSHRAHAEWCSKRKPARQRTTATELRGGGSGRRVGASKGSHQQDQEDAPAASDGARSHKAKGKGEGKASKDGSRLRAKASSKCRDDGARASDRPGSSGMGMGPCTESTRKGSAGAHVGGREGVRKRSRGDGGDAQNLEEQHVQHCRKMGNSCMKSMKFEEAVKHYTQAILLSSSASASACSRLLYANRSKALASCNRYAEALEDANKCIQLGDLETGHRYRGEALLGLGRLVEAEEASAVANMYASGQPVPPSLALLGGCNAAAPPNALLGQQEARDGGQGRRGGDTGHRGPDHGTGSRGRQSVELLLNPDGTITAKSNPELVVSYEGDGRLVLVKQSILRARKLSASVLDVTAIEELGDDAPEGRAQGSDGGHDMETDGLAGQDFLQDCSPDAPEEGRTAALASEYVQSPAGGEAACLQTDTSANSFGKELVMDEQGVSRNEQRGIAALPLLAAGSCATRRKAVSEDTLAGQHAASAPQQDAGSDSAGAAEMHAGWAVSGSTPWAPAPFSWEDKRHCLTGLTILYNAVKDGCRSHLIIDTRSRQAFEKSHMWGAVQLHGKASHFDEKRERLQVDEALERYTDLSGKDIIVINDDGEMRHAEHALGTTLKARQPRSIKKLAGGYAKWIARYPLMCDGTAHQVLSAGAGPLDSATPASNRASASPALSSVSWMDQSAAGQPVFTPHPSWLARNDEEDAERPLDSGAKAGKVGMEDEEASDGEDSEDEENEDVPAADGGEGSAQSGRGKGAVGDANIRGAQQEEATGKEAPAGSRCGGRTGRESNFNPNGLNAGSASNSTSPSDAEDKQPVKFGAHGEAEEKEKSKSSDSVDGTCSPQRKGQRATTAGSLEETGKKGSVMQGDLTSVGMDVAFAQSKDGAGACAAQQKAEAAEHVARQDAEYQVDGHSTAGEHGMPNPGSAGNALAASGPAYTVAACTQGSNDASSSSADPSGEQPETGHLSQDHDKTMSGVGDSSVSPDGSIGPGVDVGVQNQVTGTVADTDDADAQPAGGRAGDQVAHDSVWTSRNLKVKAPARLGVGKSVKVLIPGIDKRVRVHIQEGMLVDGYLRFCIWQNNIGEVYASPQESQVAPTEEHATDGSGRGNRSLPFEGEEKSSDRLLSEPLESLPPSGTIPSEIERKGKDSSGLAAKEATEKLVAANHSTKDEEGCEKPTARHGREKQVKDESERPTCASKRSEDRVGGSARCAKLKEPVVAQEASVKQERGVSHARHGTRLGRDATDSALAEGKSPAPHGSSNADEAEAQSVAALEKEIRRLKEQVSGIDSTRPEKRSGDHKKRKKKRQALSASEREAMVAEERRKVALMRATDLDL